MDGNYTGEELASDLSAAWTRATDDVTSLMAILPAIPGAPDPT
jgi:hypothetical protein